jgi:DNA-binding response OmpR family regulator
MPASQRVLLVDDESAFAGALAEGLRQDGFAVRTVGDGARALDLIRSDRFDVIVLDLMLPGLDGFDVCTRLRSAGVQTPVLVLTARTADRDQVRALDIGADDFLTKPFSYSVLLARLHALVRRAGTPTAAVLTAGDLTIDRRSGRCRRGDTDIELTSREFSLLELLMSRPGELVSKRVALDRIWGPALGEESNVVEVYIGYLRRKIDIPFGRHTICTVRGSGYRMDVDGG